MERVCIFIDGSNLYYQLKELGSDLKIDYYKLSKTLSGKDRRLIRTYYYVCPPIKDQQQSYHNQQKFFSYLKNTAYFQLIFGSLEERGDTQVEKGVDVNLAVDMVSFAYTDVYDSAILISNDADLVPAVDRVMRLGKHVEYVHFSKKSVALVEACDITVSMDDAMLQKIQP